MGGRDVRRSALAWLGRLFLRLLSRTTRVTRTGTEHYLRFRRRGEAVIFVFWHGQLLPLIDCHRNEGVVVLVSEHGDGELIARVIERAGFATVRGSSTRGGVRGLRGLVRAAREGHDLALTPDGPQGPARRVKAGALAVARLTGHPLIPVAAGASRAWNAGSWETFLVPKPFARVHVAYGAPVRIDRDATDEALKREAVALGEELDRLSQAVGAGATDPGAAAVEET